MINEITLNDAGILYSLVYAGKLPTSPKWNLQNLLKILRRCSWDVCSRYPLISYVAPDFQSVHLSVDPH